MFASLLLSAGNAKGSPNSMRLQKGIHKVKFKRVAECVSSRASACVLLLFLGLLFAPRALADDTFVFAVQISAVVQVSPPQITLNWEPDPFGAVSFTIYRKAKNDTAWGAPIATLSGTTLTYTDYNVVAGSDYEYQIIKTTTNATDYGATATMATVIFGWASIRQ